MNFKILAFVILSAFAIIVIAEDPPAPPPAPPAGGGGGARAKEMVEQMAADVLMKLKEKSPELADDTKVAAIGVKTYNDKDVPGLSYFVRVKAGELFYHVRFVDNEGKASLMVVKGPLGEKDPLVYFE